MADNLDRDHVTTLRLTSKVYGKGKMVRNKHCAAGILQEHN